MIRSIKRNIMRLQRFAVDTVMNKTTTTGLTGLMKTYYDTELLENARPNLYYAQFAKQQPLPRNNGRTIEFRKWNTLANASALTEGVIPNGQALAQTVVNATLEQFGTYVTVSDLLDLHAIDPVILGATEELGASAGLTIDTLVRNVAVAGTNVMYADKVAANGTRTAVTSRANLDKTALLDDTTVNQAATMLKKMNAPTINGKYVAIIHPSVAYDLRECEGWIEAHKYAATTEIFNGEIGELHNVRFVESTNAKIVMQTGTGALAVYQCLFLGKDAYGQVDPDGGGLEMIVKTRGEIGGPLEQFSTVGYKFENASVILYNERMVRVECCSFYSDIDTAN